MALDDGIIQTRNYQQEMFEQSLKGNVVVVVRPGEFPSRMLELTPLRWIPAVAKLMCERTWLVYPSESPPDVISAIRRIQWELDRCHPSKVFDPVTRLFRPG